jgi:hypothetical protein
VQGVAASDSALNQLQIAMNQDQFYPLFKFEWNC